MKFNKTFLMLACASSLSLSSISIAQEKQSAEAASGGKATALTMGVTAAVVAAGILVIDNSGSDLSTFEPTPVDPVDPGTPDTTGTTTTTSTSTTGTSGTDGTNNTSATGTSSTR